MEIKNLTSNTFYSSKNSDGTDVIILNPNETREISQLEFRELVGYVDCIRNGDAEIVYNGSANSDSSDTQINRIDSFYNLENGYRSHLPSDGGALYTGHEDFSLQDSRWKGSSSQVDGFITRAWKGNGTNAYIENDSNAPTLSKDIGVSLFYKQNALNIVRGYVFTMRRVGNLNHYTQPVMLYKDTDGSFIVFAHHAGETSSARSEVRTSIYDDTEWHNITISYNVEDSKPLKVYVDGVLDHATETSQKTGTSLPSCDKFVIGGYYDSSGYRLYSDAQISNFYWSTNPNFKYYIDYFANQKKEWFL